ncbi:conserved protein of unknown function [Rhodovastum atsumiense]|uniref:Uncharacterized protein n=1 Tax=Rhodovastum atsumiense TaxID=504468 RepID=A0A5M6IMB6_9PROT|nr:hypothetical protein [Rhodovastum atsumiense]KAA5609391.1 hypothetical protein F1189_24240 [Rhodovastum atsumiense]CAH2601855.1 conserved protein of unknown function [Rhodovastum atsumiense]
MPDALRSAAAIAATALMLGITVRLSHADCLVDVDHAQVTATAMTNELSRRFALYHLQQARIEAMEGEEECREHLEEAERIIETQPFTLAPGERLGLPESEAPPPVLPAQEAMSDRQTSK